VYLKYVQALEILSVLQHSLPNQKLRVIDLTTPRKKFNPTTFEDKELVIALSLVDILKQLSMELSKLIAQIKR
jgi:hypothetical protein